MTATKEPASLLAPPSLVTGGGVGIDGVEVLTGGGYGTPVPVGTGGQPYPPGHSGG